MVYHQPEVSRTTLSNSTAKTLPQFLVWVVVNILTMVTNDLYLHIAGIPEILSNR